MTPIKTHEDATRTFGKAVPGNPPAPVPPWSPPKWENTRAGADDHKRIPSRGLK